MLYTIYIGITLLVIHLNLGFLSSSYSKREVSDSCTSTNYKELGPELAVVYHAKYRNPLKDYTIEKL